jgi:hypothetical protein
MLLFAFRLFIPDHLSQCILDHVYQPCRSLHPSTLNIPGKRDFSFSSFSLPLICKESNMCDQSRGEDTLSISNIKLGFRVISLCAYFNLHKQLAENLSHEGYRDFSIGQDWRYLALLTTSLYLLSDYSGQALLLEKIW